MDAIRAWRREKTTIIITNDISWIREEDFVYVLENGRIIGDGY
jgi:ATP-binding cassette, subfamily B (MDR/TAP), member 1